MVGQRTIPKVGEEKMKQNPEAVTSKTQQIQLSRRYRNYKKWMKIWDLSCNHFIDGITYSVSVIMVPLTYLAITATGFFFIK